MLCNIIFINFILVKYCISIYNSCTHFTFFIILRYQNKIIIAIYYYIVFYYTGRPRHRHYHYYHYPLNFLAPPLLSICLCMNYNYYCYPYQQASLGSKSIISISILTYYTTLCLFCQGAICHLLYTVYQFSYCYLLLRISPGAIYVLF